MTRLESRRGGYSEDEVNLQPRTRIELLSRKPLPPKTTIAAILLSFIGVIVMILSITFMTKLSMF